MDNDFYVGDKVLVFQREIRSIDRISEIGVGIDIDGDSLFTRFIERDEIKDIESIDKIKFRDPNLCQHCPGRRSLCGNCFINKYPIKILPGDTVIYRNERGNYIGRVFIISRTEKELQGIPINFKISEPYYRNLIEIPESQVSFYKRPENKKPRERCLSDMKKFCSDCCIYDCKGCKIKEILEKNV